MLQDHLAAGSGFLEQLPAAELASALEGAPPAASPRPGPESATIGGYRLLRRIGAGGMGVVYEAEQERPRRLVALKVIRWGTVADDLRLKLFEREVEALARLRHPGIAAIYQAGQTDDGEPFFAMELAHGTTLGEALRGEGPAAGALRDLPSRLRLFVRICEAVNYAHQRGVVHRDLKPANILVGAAPDSAGASALPEVKILDFGLARVADPEGPSPLVTQAGTIQGTLAYMSPEQARGRPDEVDLRTDVYSLGVILYELVAGALPYELGGRPADEAIRFIRDEPPRPLRGPTRIGPGSSGPPRVARDLETIVMKALEKEPARRYQSALTLAEEIERYLRDEPILARGPSATYQLGRLVRRHRTAFGLAAATFLLVAASAVFMTVERNRARAAEAQARLEAARATAIKDFLKGILASGDPRRQGREARVLDVIEDAARRLGSSMQDQPDVKAALHDTLSESFYYLGQYDQARQQAEAAVRLHQVVSSKDDLATLKSTDNLVAALIGQGRFGESEALAREVIERKRRVLGPAHRETLASLGQLSTCLLSLGQWVAAEGVAREVAETGARVLPPGDEVTLNGLNDLGVAVRKQGRLGEAESLLRRLVELSLRTRSESDPKTLEFMTNLVGALNRSGKLAEAEVLGRRVLALKRRVLGPSHAETVISQSGLGLVLCRQGQPEGAQVYADLLKIVSAPGFESRNPAELYQERLGECLVQLGRHAEAEPLLLSSYQALVAKLGPEDARTREALAAVVGLYVAWGRPSEAAPWQALQQRPAAPR